MINFGKVPVLIYIIGALLIFSSVIAGKFMEEIAISVLVLLAIFTLFYKENEPPVIVISLGFQWLSIAIAHFYLLFFNATQSDLLWRPSYSLSEIEQTFWLSMIALVAFCIGLKIATYNVKVQLAYNYSFQKYDTFKIIVFYILFSAIFEPLANLVRFSIPGIYQALKVLTFFKWSLFFLMIYISFKKNEKKKLVFGIIAVETLIGFTGYFSEFKDYIILFPVVYLSFNKIKGRKQIAILTLIAVILINIGAIWSYVKVEYRPYLSGGERSQVVTVSKQEALKKLWDLSTNINKQTYSMGFEAMIKRIYFLEYFSATINHIPKLRPYLHGEIWTQSLQHILMPRLFFPEKEAIDDSKQTYILTGIQVADAEKGASISAGYMAESYADFGEYNMHLAILILGFLLGLIYKHLLNNSLNQLWGFALIIPMYFLLNINGKSLIKIFGDTAYFFIVFYFLKRYIVPFVDPYLRQKE